MKKLILTLSAAATLLIGAATLVLSQQTSPNELPGCIYNATPPTLSDKQSIVIQCDINGKIKTH